MDNGSTQESGKYSTDTTGKGFCEKFVQNKTYRVNFVLTLSIVSSFFVLGWSIGQSGPVFLDLTLITNVSIDRGSAYFTATTVGYLVGAFITGAVFDKIENKTLLNISSLLLFGVTTFAVPWCTSFCLMVCVKALYGISSGGLDTSGNALLFRIRKGKVGIFMQCIHFGFALGGSLSPLATAPFLTPNPDDDNTSTTITPEIYRNGTGRLGDNGNKGESIVYIVFLITGALAILSSLPFTYIFVSEQIYKTKKSKSILGNENVIKEEEVDTNLPAMSTFMKIIVVIILMLIFMTYCGVESLNTAFLTTFCVKYFKWSKFDSALIASAYWAAFATGRLSGIFMVKFFSPVTLIFVYASSMILSIVGMFLSSWYSISTGMWICTTLLGLFCSVIFPSVFTWTEESFIHVNGRISSFFLCGACLSGAVNPLLLGHLMEASSYMWFVYMLLGEAVLMFTVMVLALQMARRLRKHKIILHVYEQEVVDD